MNFPSRRAALALAGAALFLAGCSRSSSPAEPKPEPHLVTANSGGDTRGTLLYHPPAPPQKPINPYALVSDKFVIGQRQHLAWALAEIDNHAHLQALHAFPVPDPSWKGYTKQNALLQALRQAQFNAYLLEKYHAHFCNQYHLTYDQLILIVREGREKQWPMPPPPTDE